MKILMCSQYNTQNTYVSDLIDELRNFAEVHTEVSTFWDSKEDFDVIHIQWPEELLGWVNIDKEKISALKKRITYYKSRNSKIVTTLHNATPHIDNIYNKELYQYIYNETDVIVHLGAYSTRFYPYKKNVIIHHSNYEKHITIDDKKSSKEKKFFCFGKIRNPEEEQQIIDGFLAAKIPDSKLIISNSLLGKNPYYGEGKLSLRKWKYIWFLKKLKKRNIKLITAKIPKENINNYFNNASVIISPRINTLNSGVIYMALTFGKPVIGPDQGNIGEFLKTTNNPTFTPNDKTSIATAMQRALNSSNLGKENLTFSRKNLSARTIAEKHYQLYQNLSKTD